MKAKITEFEKTINTTDIAHFEEQINRSLPESLKQLFLKYNGGVIEKIEEEYDFFSIKYGDLKMEDMINTLQVVEQIIPIEYLPFANSPIGHIVTFSLSDDDSSGKIFLFRHDDLEPILISNSLEEFLGVSSINDF
nr:SMI1/KNR4 family protein [uncultured Psychroserpens sp.]